MTYLVSIISDHVLPCYLFIKEMTGKYDKLLFITSHKMVGSGRGKLIERTLGIPANSIQRLVVSDEDLNDTMSGLRSQHFSSGDQFIVNLSSDRIILALAAFEYFSTFTASFYYLPPGKNIIENVQTSDNAPLHYRVNVWEYLTVHGFRFEYKEKMTYPKVYTFELFERYKRAGYNRNNVTEMRYADQLDYPDCSYFSGAWFEEYVFHRIKAEKDLRDDCIYTSVKIFHEGSGKINDNEIDIVFVINNELYIGECKMSLKGTPDNRGTKLLEQFMYKLAAISMDYGLNVRQFIFTLHRFNKNNPEQITSIKRKMKLLSLEGLLDRDSFKNNVLTLDFI